MRLLAVFSTLALALTATITQASSLPHQPQLRAAHTNGNDNQHVLGSSSSEPRWLSVPPTPKLPKADVEARLKRPDGASIWYAQYWPKSHHLSKKAKSLPPVVFLHGGLAASIWLGHQIAHFKESRHVIAIDSRAQGRSTNGNGTLLTYDVMTDDVVAILDHLKISKAALVGWSDGGIIGLDFALRHASRIDRVFSFAPNYDINGTLDVTKSPAFLDYIDRAKVIYEKINPTHDYQTQYDAVTTMWATLPNWKESDFTALPASLGRRIWIADGDHEEAVKRYQIDNLAAWIKDSGEVIIPQTSHFAFLQDTTYFNNAIQSLLDVQF
ncbi:hypothetical protein OC846_005703 [Tilletia horrida]|uniref:AB hydrolase-1 domain-containing protein n=1 Tax=Tilletia horrida TaxID=155126 RepID=A0AAN6GL87_9BASI|nr:hypothetical protein OC845_005851 [Tilletia horrida]KAK0545357.1 hypothetical protein OC846_005703 [Tilletia horrida]KAK0561300.1 hypothetical protein OC861_005879 [Tilletia horrida]